MTLDINELVRKKMKDDGFNFETGESAGGTTPDPSISSQESQAFPVEEKAQEVAQQKESQEDISIEDMEKFASEGKKEEMREEEVAGIDSGTSDMTVEERLSLMNKDYTEKSQQNATKRKELEKREAEIEKERLRLEAMNNQMMAYQQAQQVPVSTPPQPPVKGTPEYSQWLAQQTGLPIDEYTDPVTIELAQRQVTLNQELENNKKNIMQTEQKRRAAEIGEEWEGVKKKKSLPEAAQYPVLSMLLQRRWDVPNITMEQVADEYLASFGITDNEEEFVNFVRNSKHYGAIKGAVVSDFKAARKGQPPIPSAGSGGKPVSVSQKSVEKSKFKSVADATKAAMQAFEKGVFGKKKTGRQVVV